jgi:putative ABC transport system permease protein
MTYSGLFSGYILLLVPLAVFLWVRGSLVSKLCINAIRMTVQLLLVGFYLQHVFVLDSHWINGLWILVMICVADLSIVRGAGVSLKKLYIPVFMALLVGVTIPLSYFVLIILKRPEVLEARLVIPIGGMILGNCLRADIIGIKSFFRSIKNGDRAYTQQLADGATITEATRPYFRQAIEDALAPSLANMGTIGLVSLPGMMTGVILGGSDPRTAVMYQIAIMIAIFTGTSITVFTAIFLSRRVAFNKYGLLKKDIL